MKSSNEASKLFFKTEFTEALESGESRALENLLRSLNKRLKPQELSDIVNQPIDSNGNSSLHLASIKGNKDLATLLIKYGAQLDLENNLNRTPLKEAELANATKFGKALNALSFGYTDYQDTTETQSFIKETDQNIKKLQSIARGIKHRNDLKEAQAAREIFTKALKEYKAPNDQDLKGTIQAIYNKYGPKRTADILNHPLDKNGNSALHFAAINGDVDLARLLVKFGAKHLLRNKAKDTPEKAAEKNQRSLIGIIANYPDTKEVQKYLSNPKQDLDFFLNRNLARTAIADLTNYHAHNASNDSPKQDILATAALSKLQEISKTADFQRNPLEYIDTQSLPILEAIILAQKDKKHPLYQKGSAGWVNYYDHDNFIANAIKSAKETLQVTAEFESTLKKTIALNAFKKAFKTYQTSKDLTVLKITLKKMDKETAEYVLNESLDARGNSSLHIAAQKGDKALAEVLVKNGADVFAKNARGETAEIVAEKNQRSGFWPFSSAQDTIEVKKYLSNVPNIQEIQNLAKNLTPGNIGLQPSKISKKPPTPFRTQ